MRAAFEVAAAYVTVTPDASDFAQALDEEIGGLTVAVRVLPDASDLQGGIDQEDLTASVRLAANAAGLADQVDEATSGMSATIAVGADVAPAQGELHGLLDEIDEARGDLFVGADTGAARKQAQDLADEVSGITAQLTVGADTGGSSGGVQALTGDLDQLGGAAAQAQAELSGVSGAVAALESRAADAAASVSGVIGALAGGGAGAEVGALVVPEVSADFEAKVEEDAGGLAVSALVVPNTADLQDRLDEAAGDLTLPVTLEAGGGLGSAGAEVGEYTGAAAEGLAAVERAAEAAGDAVAMSAEQFDRYVAGRAASQAGIDALSGLTAAAAEANASIEDDLDSMEAEAARLSEALREVDAQFLSMANAQFGPATDAELADLTSQFEILYRTIGSVSEEIGGLRGDFAAAGGEFEGLDTGLSQVSSALTAFDESLAGTEEALGIVAGDFFEMQEQATRMGVSLDDLGPALDSAFAGWAARADAAKASLAALNGEAGEMGGKVAAGAGEAGEAAEGLGGIFGSLAGRLSYMAVDPFMWMMAVPMMIGPIEEGIKELGEAMNPVSGQVQELHQQVEQQTAALGFSASAWERLAQTEKDYGAAAGSPLISQETNTAVKDLSAGAENLAGHIAELGQKYDITTAQSEALAAASGVSAKQLAGSGAAAASAMSKVEAYANANVGATGPVNELSNDMLAFGNDTLTASSRVTALDDAYNMLVGNFIGTQQAQLTVQQDFLTFASNATQAGASMTGTNQASLTLKQSFTELPGAIEQTANAMTQQGDSVKQVTGYVDEQIGRLEKLGGQNAMTATTVKGLKEWEDKAAASTKGLGGALNDLPKNVQIALEETAKGTWSEAELMATGSANIQGLPGALPVSVPGQAVVKGLAGGGMVSGGSGSPTADDIPARLSAGEYVVSAGAVGRYGAAMLDDINAQRFASGGLASYSGAVSGLGPWNQQQYTSTADALASALISSADAAGKSAQASAGNVAGTVSGALTGATGSVQAMAQKAAAALGWTGAQWAALNAVEMAEASWNLGATNPTSGAYGIAQFIGGPSEYAQYGGNSNTAAGQITAMLNYIAQRYGNPEAAEAHEACVPLSVDILTRRGWLLYDQLREGDETVGYNFATGRSEWTPITAVHIYDDAPLVRLTNKTWEAVCTPNHRWVARKHVQTPRKVQDGGPKTTSAVVEEFIGADKISTRHGLMLAASADLGDGPAISEQEAEILGWVLGDGSVAWIKSKKPGSTEVRPSVRVYQSKPEHVKAIDALVDGLMFYRMEREMDKPDGVKSELLAVTWEFTRPYSEELLKRSGYDHRNPVPFVLSLNEAQRTAFLRGVFGAEGSYAGNGEGFAERGYHKYPRTKVYYQADGPQQDAIILAVYLSGKRPGISPWTAKQAEDARRTLLCPNPKPGATIRETKPHLGGESIKRTDAGRDAVWCVTTGLGSWTMRQGRHVSLTGNSYHWYKNGGHMRPGETGVVGEAGPEFVTAGPSGATITPGGRSPNVVNVYLQGISQFPSPEQIANIKSEMAYALVAPP